MPCVITVYSSIFLWSYKIEKALIDGTTGEARNTTELLHNGLKDNFRRVFAKLSGPKGDKPLKQEITTIRNEIQKRLIDANPSYAKATSIYNEATGATQLLDRSIVGQFANVVDLGGTKAASLSKKLFSGNIKPDEIVLIRNKRRVSFQYEYKLKIILDNYTPSTCREISV